MKQHSVRNSILTFLFSLILYSAFAQNEATMYFMNSLPQVTYLNPASVPRYRFSLGIPGSSVFFRYSNNGFAYNDVMKKEGNVVKADLQKLYDAMADKNRINTNAQADLFRFSMKANARMYITLNATAKAYNHLMLPKDVAGIFINGTLAYVNSTATLSPQVESVGYMETGAGASYIVNRKLTVGAKLKFLKGAANVTTNNARFDLSLDADYAITIQGSADVKTSGAHNFDNSNYEVEDSWRDFLNNNGFAFDLGFTYKATDKLTVGFSAIDIGGITWKNDTYGYQLNSTTANYTFRGIDLEKVIDGNTDYFEAEIDTIENRFELTEGKIGSYRTPLPAKLYFSGEYRLARNFNAGLLLFGEKLPTGFSSGISASLCKDFGRRLTTSVSYTIANRSFNNLGLGLALNFAPIQIYVVGDNLLRAPIALLSGNTLNAYVNSMQNFNLRAGLNFVFGWDKTQERQPYPGKIR